MVVPIQIAIIPMLQLFVWFTNATGIQIIGQYPAAWIVHSAVRAAAGDLHPAQLHVRPCRTR